MIVETRFRVQGGSRFRACLECSDSCTRDAGISALSARKPGTILPKSRVHELSSPDQDWRCLVGLEALCPCLRIGDSKACTSQHPSSLGRRALGFSADDSAALQEAGEAVTTIDSPFRSPHSSLGS